jgi:hypothetical protein
LNVIYAVNQPINLKTVGYIVDPYSGCKERAEKISYAYRIQLQSVAVWKAVVCQSSGLHVRGTAYIVLFMVWLTNISELALL